MRTQFASPTSRHQYEIARACAKDIPEILELQQANLAANGGSLSVQFSSEWFESTMADMPIIVARHEGQLVAYLVSSSPAATRNVTLSQAKFRAYPPQPQSYNYGPICISTSERGQGLAATMFEQLRAQLPGHEAVGFIRCDNSASLRAHAKLGLKQVARFSEAGIDYVVIACKH
jgi:L-amino acid N-acyltransferase YncA